MGRWTEKERDSNGEMTERCMGSGSGKDEMRDGCREMQVGTDGEIDKERETAMRKRVIVWKLGDDEEIDWDD